MIAVISDVHGNLPALEAVLEQIDAADVQRIWCLGDTLGYGPFVNECMQLVSQRCEIVLAGNHDLAVRGELSTESFVGTAEAGVRYAQEVLDEASRALLARLTPHRHLDEVELYHASAHDPIWEYVRDTGAARRHLQLQRRPLSLVGHSHMQLAFELADGGERVTGGARTDGDTLQLSAGARRVVNPGAVGQPRDRDPRAAWALLDAQQLTFRRVDYDIARMQAAVTAAGLPEEIGSRLLLGW